MAKRPAWTITDDGIVCKEFEFEWNGGFAVVQKQKNITNLHGAIFHATGETALEISSKSTNTIGKTIGAFFLKSNDIYLENIFQSSKVFEKGGPYADLLTVSPKEAKQDERLKTSGALLGFEWDKERWPLEPKTLFYDYLYIKTMVENHGKEYPLSDYAWFTDIEFNPSRSINCQARSAAIYKFLQKKQLFCVLDEKEAWLDFHKKWVKG